MGCLMLPCVSFRLSEEEKKLSEELHDIIKSSSDIGKEVFVTLVSPNWVIVPKVSYSLQFCYASQMCYYLLSKLQFILAFLDTYILLCT